MASSSSSFLQSSLRLVCTYLQILFSKKVLFLIRSLFLQVSKTWVTDCTLLHSLQKGSFVMVFLKLLSWLSSVQLASIRILVKFNKHTSDIG